MTEMSTQITCTPQGASGACLGSSGRSLLENSVRVNGVGEIEVRGATRFQGYLVGDVLELDVTEDGWFGTGDRGCFDDGGNLHVEGRIDRQFISGGENIQPESIEQALCQLEGVLQAAVIGVEDEEFGWRPVAFVRVRGGLDEDGLKDGVRARLPGFMVPLRILSWPEGVGEGMKWSLEELRKAWGSVQG